jgi:TolB-like protein
MKFSKEASYKTSQEAAIPQIAGNRLKQASINRGDSFAVLPFVVLSSDSRYNQLSQGFAENLPYYLVNSQAVKVIERTQMDKAIQEMRLGMTGIVDNSTAQAIGKVLGAKYVVIGSVEIFGDHVEINCRVLQVQSSVNILVEKVSGTVDDLFTLRNDLGQRISEQVAMSVEK